MYNPLYEKMIQRGIDICKNEEAETQSQIISKLLKGSRGMDYSILRDTDAFFLSTSKHAVKLFGSSALDPENDIFDPMGNHRYLNKIIFPLYNAEDHIVGLIGHDPFQKIIRRDIERLEKKEQLTEQEQEKLNDLKSKRALKYILPSSNIAPSRLHIYFPKGVYRKCVKDGYAVIVDGMFDCIQLNYLGINSLCLMGSSISPEMFFMLSFIKTKFVAYDNDSSGVGVYRKIIRKFPDAVAIKNRVTGDIDEYINKFGGNDIKVAIENRLSTGLMRPIILMGNSKSRFRKDV